MMNFEIHQNKKHLNPSKHIQTSMPFISSERERRGEEDEQGGIRPMIDHMQSCRIKQHISYQ